MFGCYSVLASNLTERLTTQQFATHINRKTGKNIHFPIIGYKVAYKIMPNNPPSKPGIALILGTLLAIGLIGDLHFSHSSSLYFVSIHAILMGCLVWQLGQVKNSSSSDMSMKGVEIQRFYPILTLDSAMIEGNS